jgi:hypothetical protein
MDVREVLRLQPLEICGAFNRELHRVNVGDDLGRARADRPSGLLVDLGPSKAPSIPRPLTMRSTRCGKGAPGSL